MNLTIDNCGGCPLRQGKYTCLGLDERRDEVGVKRQIEADQHHIQPGWCPLPITINPEEPRQMEDASAGRDENLEEPSSPGW